MNLSFFSAIPKVLAGALSLLLLVACTHTPRAIPEKYKSYEFLSSKSLKSDTLELVEILDSSESREGEIFSIFYDKPSQIFTVLLRLSDGSRGNYRTEMQVIRFDNDGEIVQKFTSNAKDQIEKVERENYRDSFDGIQFYNRRYLDVFQDNEIQLVAYDYEVDMSTLSVEEFIELYDKADLVYYGKVSSRQSQDLDDIHSKATIYHDVFNTYMSIDDQWIKFESKVSRREKLGLSFLTRKPRDSEAPANDLFSLYTEEYPYVRTKVAHPKRAPEKHRTQLVEFASFDEQLSPILIRKYKAKEHYYSCGLRVLVDYNGHCLSSGWKGASYYHVEHNDKRLKFKSYESIYIYHPQFADTSGSVDDAKMPVFLRLYENINNYGTSEKSNLFLVKAHN